MIKFKDFSKHEMLLIDDIQFMNGKGSKEEFFILSVV